MKIYYDYSEAEPSIFSGQYNVILIPTTAVHYCVSKHKQKTQTDKKKNNNNKQKAKRNALCVTRRNIA